MTIVGPACHAGPIGAESERLQVVAIFSRVDSRQDQHTYENNRL